MDNFYISHSEKNFLGGGRRGREAGGALSGDLITILHYQILNKSTLKSSLSMPLERIKTAIKGGLTSYPYLPLRNPLDRTVGGILVPIRSQSIPIHF